MKLNKSEILYKKYQAKLKPLYNSADSARILHCLKNGKNTYMRLDRLESSAFEDSWISVIEDCLFDLGDIVTNPRTVTKTDANVVPVELAKKINGDSVQHLASHTQFIKEIDENGNVIPNKLLSMSNDDDLHTYENRFIATFIRQLVLFIEKRYEFVRHFSPLHNEQILYVKNHSFVDGNEVEIETKIKVRSEAFDENALTSNKYIERIKKIREYVLYYYNSPFMKSLKTDKDVRRPILQTNIIRKNPKYHHCFEVYTFINKYEKLGVDYKLDESYSLLNEEEMDEINQMNLINFLTLHGNYMSENVKESTKVYKPKILTSMDDESFVYGPYLNGPVEFIRVDEKFREYVDKKANPELPLHPNKRERLYYQEEFDYRKENKEDEKELDQLIKRKQKEVKDFEKKATKIIAIREQEEAEAERLRQLAIKEEEDRRIEAKRQKLINSALDDKPEETLDEVPVNEEPIPEEAPVEEALVEEQEVVSFDEAPVGEESPVEEQPLIEEPTEESQEEPTPEPQMEETPAVEETPAEEEPQQEGIPEEEPQVEEQPVEEAPLEEEPVKEEPKKKAPRKPRVKKAKETPIKEEKPVEEVPESVPEVIPEEPREEKVEEPVQEEAPIEEEPVSPINEEIGDKDEIQENNEQIPMEEEKSPQKADILAEKGNLEENKTKKAPSRKKDKEKKKEKAPKAKKEKPQEKKIPGKFIVKTHQGYYVKKGTFSEYKHEAKIYDDFVEAKKIKKEFGGKVVKLS